MEKIDNTLGRENNSEDNLNDTLISRKHVVTIIVCIISIILYIGINMEKQHYSWEIYKKWGAPWIIDIFNGSYWGLFTSAFLHIEIWHIFFNLYWFWLFGKKIESETNSLSFLSVIISLAIISSLAQMLFTGNTGIGLSGVGYGLFGFIYVKSRSEKEYKDFLSEKTIRLFIGWLIICIILTHFNLWYVGNAAHIGGLIWGVILAYISKHKRAIQLSIGILAISMLVYFVFNSPLSVAYLSDKAYQLHEEQQIDEAIVAYSKVLSRDPENEFAKTNIKQLQVHKMSERAYKLHSDGSYDEARDVYIEILKVDELNKWAKDNLDLLPDKK